MYDRFSEVDDFLSRFERQVLEEKCFEALKWVLCAMPMRWWGMHQRSFEGWHELRMMMNMLFGKPQI